MDPDPDPKGPKTCKTDFLWIPPQGRGEEVVAYIARIPESHAKNIRTDSILRTAKFKTDTEGFLESLKTADMETDRKTWLLDPKLLMQAFEKTSGLGENILHNND